MTYSNGGKYVGHFQNGKPHGQGTPTSANGSVYEGDWQNDKYMAKEHSTQLVLSIMVILRMVTEMAKNADAQMVLSIMVIL